MDQQAVTLYGDQAVDQAAAGGVMAAFGALWFIYLVLIIVMIAAMWKLFTKAGKPGWAAIVPIYNMIVWLEIVGRPVWWVLLLFIPVANLVIAIMLYLDLAKAFGKDVGFAILMLLFPFVFVPILAFGNASYQGPVTPGSPAPAAA